MRRVSSAQLQAADLARLHDLFRAAWPAGDFGPEDEAHAMGGTHWIAEAQGRIVGHASVVPRVLEAAGVPLETGYVEAVATHPAWRYRGIATRLMAAAGDHVREAYRLGALSTGLPILYERLGWERWRGPTFVRTAGRLLRTPEEDDGVMVLRTPRTPALSGMEALSCDWRPGDCW